MVDISTVTPSSGFDSPEDSEEEEYPVKRILERWGKNDFLLEWMDGTCSWVPRFNIDEELMNDFEKTYRGLDEGVTVLRTRKIRSKTQFRVH